MISENSTLELQQIKADARLALDELQSRRPYYVSVLLTEILRLQKTGSAIIEMDCRVEIILSLHKDISVISMRLAGQNFLVSATGQKPHDTLDDICDLLEAMLEKDEFETSGLHVFQEVKEFSDRDRERIAIFVAATDINTTITFENFRLTLLRANIWNPRFYIDMGYGQIFMNAMWNDDPDHLIELIKHLALVQSGLMS